MSRILSAITVVGVIILLAVSLLATADSPDVSVVGICSSDPDDSNMMPAEMSNRMKRWTTAIFPTELGSELTFAGEDWRIRSSKYLGTFLESSPSCCDLDMVMYLAIATYEVDGRTVVTPQLLRKQIDRDDEEEWCYSYRRFAAPSSGPVNAIIESFNLGSEHYGRFILGWVSDPAVDHFTVQLSDGRWLRLDADQHEFFIGVLDQVRFRFEDLQLLGDLTIDKIRAFDASGKLVE